MKYTTLLEGKRTYIAAALIALVTFLRYAGLLDDSVSEILLTLLGAGGLAALRAAKT